uniref:Uncharacterized protein n=1 Tax=Pipistrellus kuhlii TaxID=59472 RepID=A0A7J7TA68_PIPKU|nr:hypothetical protein mPipKuh1_009691 [Pipistrellus kuhlii]
MQRLGPWIGTFSFWRQVHDPRIIPLPPSLATSEMVQQLASTPTAAGAGQSDKGGTWGVDWLQSNDSPCWTLWSPRPQPPWFYLLTSSGASFWRSPSACSTASDSRLGRLPGSGGRGGPLCPHSNPTSLSWCLPILLSLATGALWRYNLLSVETSNISLTP